MKRLIRNENGSITIEAALIIPIFLTFVLFLSSLIKITVAEMALQKAVDETAQNVSHYSYLAMVAQKKIKKTTDGFVDSLTDKSKEKLGNHTIANHLLEKISQAGKDFIPTSGEAINHFSDGMYQNMVRASYEKHIGQSQFYNPGGIRVVDSSFPQGTSGEAANVKIEAENTLKIVVPFFEQEVKIKKVAVERGWVGNE